MITPSVELEPRLTAHVMAMLQAQGPQLIGDAIPMMDQDDLKGTYEIYPPRQFMEASAEAIGKHQTVPFTDLVVAADTFNLRQYAHGGRLSPRDLKKPNGARLEEVQGAEVPMRVVLRTADAAAAALFSPGKWSTELQGVAAAPGAGEFIQWTDGANADPIRDIRGASTAVVQRSDFRPNRVVMSRPAWDAFSLCPRVRGELARGETLTRQRAAQILEAELVTVVNSVRAVPGSAIGEFIVPAHVLVYYAPNKRKLAAMEPSAALAFTLNDPEETLDALTVRKWYDDATRAWHYEVFAHWDIKITAADCGAILLDVL